MSGTTSTSPAGEALVVGGRVRFSEADLKVRSHERLGRLKAAPTTEALPAVTVEFEAALEALDAPLHLGEVVRLATAGTRGVLGIEVGGGSGGGVGSGSWRLRGAHRPKTIRSSLSSATVARSMSAALATQAMAAAPKASGPGA